MRSLSAAGGYCSWCTAERTCAGYKSFTGVAKETVPGSTSCYKGRDGDELAATVVFSLVCQC